jgi:hypothetical protein
MLHPALPLNQLFARRRVCCLSRAALNILPWRGPGAGAPGLRFRQYRYLLG